MAWLERQDQGQSQAFVQKIQELAVDSEVGGRFSDECDVEENTWPCRHWVPRVSHPKIPYRAIALKYV